MWEHLEILKHCASVKVYYYYMNEFNELSWALSYFYMLNQVLTNKYLV